MSMPFLIYKQKLIYKSMDVASLKGIGGPEIPPIYITTDTLLHCYDIIDVSKNLEVTNEEEYWRSGESRQNIGGSGNNFLGVCRSEDSLGISGNSSRADRTYRVVSTLRHFRFLYL